VKKLLRVTAALAAAVAVFVAFSLPPRRMTLAPIPDGSIPGAIHIHTNRSDGSSGADEIAAAAARAGLKFIVFTDHGDATRVPDPPTYRSGVLCLDGVEISTNGGHYVALDMRVSPYPLAGEARDVVDDVRRLGGFGIAAHPDSPKPELQWKEWTAQFDGIELLNPDTSWRVWAELARKGDPAAGNARWPARRHLIEVLAAYPFRSAETIARLARPIDGILNQWAAVAARRRVVTIAGTDAHAKIDLRGDPENGRYSLPLPGYQASFRTLSIHVAAERALTGNPQSDAAAIVRAVRNGHLYVAVDGLATPPSFEFTATNDNGTVHEGDELAAGTPVRLRVRSNAPPEFTTTVWNGAAVVQTDRHEPEFTLDVAADPAVYWVEIRSQGSGAPLTWLRSNPIYVRGSEPPIRTPSRPPPLTSRPFVDAASATTCRAEHDPHSAAAFEMSPVVAGEMRFRFGLSGDSDGRQAAALVCDAPEGIALYDRLTFTTRADRPMRFSVQLRADAGDAAGERWQRSVYVDTYDQERTVYFDDVTPVGVTHTVRPPLDLVRHVLFVIDRTNAKPGASGRVWIKRVALQK
jgi:predicted metal-dependent phosphoesterase TrpH